MTNSTLNGTTLGDADKAAIGGLAAAISAAWEKQSGEAFAAVFTDDATALLPGDVFLQGREEIRDHMSAGYAGQWKGTGVTGRPLSIRFIDDHTGVMITEGGVTLPGADTVAPQHLIRATWVAVKQDGEWKISAYQNSPVNVPSAA